MGRLKKYIDLARTSLGDLKRQLIPDILPRSEEYRTYFGRSIDLNRIQSAMMQADDGQMVDITDLEREMVMLDPHLSSVCGKRFNSIGCLDWTLEAATGDHVDKELATRIADKVRRDLERIPHFEARLVDLAWGAFDARAVEEIHWGLHPGPEGWRPMDLKWVHPRRISYGSKRELRLIDTFMRTGGFHSDMGVAFDDYPGKFLQYTPRLFNEYPEREGLGPRTLYWAFFKRFDWRMRMALAELFGIPWRIIEAKEGANCNYDELKEAAAEAESLGDTTTLGLPPGAHLNIPNSGEMDGNVFKMTADDVNAEMSKLVLGNTGTTDAVANRAESIVHKSEQEVVLAFDAGGISTAVQRDVVETDVVLNYGDDLLDHAPVFKLNAEPARDTLKELERLERVIQVGVPVAVSEFREVAGVRVPGDDEAIIVSTPGGKDAMGNPLPPSIRIIDPSKPTATQPGSAPEDAQAPDQPSAAPAAGGNIALAPTDVVVVVTVDEARASQGLAPWPNAEEGAMTVSEFKAIKEAEGQIVGVAEGTAQATDVLPDDSEGGTPAPPPAAAPPASPAAAPMPPAQGKADDDETLEEQGLDGAAEAAAEDLLTARAGTPLTLAAPSAPPAAPSGDVFGSVDTITEAGADEGAKLSAELTKRFEEAADPDLDAAGMELAMSRAHAALDLRPIAESIAQTDIRSMMLGALDADWEAENDEVVKPSAFAQERALFLEATDVLFTQQPFDEAVAAFLKREVLDADTFYAMAAEARKRAFTISGLLSQRMLEVSHAELATTIEEGGDLRGFRKRLAARYEAAGYTPLNRSHVQTVYRNATMASYNTGRTEQMTQPAVLAARPYWQIVTVPDDRRRATHGAVHHKLLKADDAFWEKGPPFGHACRCRKVSRSAADVERLGLEVTDGSTIEGLPDPGWR